MSLVKMYPNMPYGKGCIPLMKCPTSCTSSYATLLNHICTSDTTADITSYILLSDISDHLPAYMTSQSMKLQAAEMIKSQWGKKHIDAVLKKSIRSAFCGFINMFITIFNKHVSLKMPPKRELKLQKNMDHKLILISIKINNTLYHSFL